jgi:hypothetical protein
MVWMTRLVRGGMVGMAGEEDADISEETTRSLKA